MSASKSPPVCDMRWTASMCSALWMPRSAASASAALTLSPAERHVISSANGALRRAAAAASRRCGTSGWKLRGSGRCFTWSVCSTIRRDVATSTPHSSIYVISGSARCEDVLVRDTRTCYCTVLYSVLCIPRVHLFPPWRRADISALLAHSDFLHVPKSRYRLFPVPAKR